MSRIKNHIPDEMLKEIVNSKKDRIGELITEMLEASLASLTRIANITTDNVWLKSQNAAELATLYGVKADKIIRILEAIERANLQRIEGAGTAAD